jgi:predicted nucleotidyltransferase
MYDLEEYKSHYEWRVGGSNIPFEDFVKNEKRKLHQGKFHGIDFFIRYIKSPEDWKGSFYDYKYENLGRIKLEAEVLDSSDSIFTPCSYKINPLKILHNSNISNISMDINVKDVIEVNSFRGRFCEHAREGENVLIEGKIEKVYFKNKTEYFRVLLGDQVKDRMILMRNS